MLRHRARFRDLRLRRIDRRQYAVIVEELVEHALDLGLRRLRSTIAHLGVLDVRLDHRDASLLALLVIRNDAGIGLEHRIMRPERQDLDLAIGHERHTQVIKRDKLLHLVRINLGEISRDVATVGMTNHGEAIIVGVRHDLLQVFNRELNVGYTALVNRKAADIELADLGHQRRIAGKVMLDADRQIATSGEEVREERVLGEFDGVAVIEDRDRQLDHASERLHFLVPAHRNINGDWPIARLIEESHRLMPNEPLAATEIGCRDDGTERKYDDDSALHVVS